MTTSKIAENLNRLNEAIHIAADRAGRSIDSVQLVAVSKRFPPEVITEAMAVGQSVFGENYVQELQEKAPRLKDRCTFHFIGHLQTNKVKPVAENCSMIETIDRIKLAQRLENILQSLERKMDGLIQVNIGREQQKSGVLPENLEALLEHTAEFKHLRVCGLMTIPPYSGSAEDSRHNFQGLRHLAEEMQTKGFFKDIDTPELSMGMSGDFHVAIEEGATIIRVGTAIFGERTL